MIFKRKDLVKYMGLGGNDKQVPHRWLAWELLKSADLKNKDFMKAYDQDELDIHFMVNGYQVEPMLLMKLYTEVEKFIDDEAEQKVKAMLEDIDVQEPLRKLQYFMNDIEYKVNEIKREAAKILGVELSEED